MQPSLVARSVSWCALVCFKRRVYRTIISAYQMKEHETSKPYEPGGTADCQERLPFSLSCVTSDVMGMLVHSQIWQARKTIGKLLWQDCARTQRDKIQQKQSLIELKRGLCRECLNRNVVLVLQLRIHSWVAASPVSAREAGPKTVGS